MIAPPPPPPPLLPPPAVGRPLPQPQPGVPVIPEADSALLLGGGLALLGGVALWRRWQRRDRDTE